MSATSEVANYEIDVRPVSWQLYGGGVSGTSGVVSIDQNGHSVEVQIPPLGGTVLAYDFEGLEVNRNLQADLMASDLTGTYRLKLVRFLADDYDFRINADGSICHQGVCGRITLSANNEGFFEFTLPDVGGPNQAADDLRGIGWLEIADGGTRELVLVGASSSETLGVVAKRVAP